MTAAPGRVTYLYGILQRRDIPDLTDAPRGLPDMGRPRPLAAGPALWLVVADAPLGRYAGSAIDGRLTDLGWVSECDVIMVAGRELDRPVDTSIVEEVSLDDLVPAWTDGWKTDPAVLGAEVMRQLVESKRRTGEVVDTRFFAARVDGEVASYCELYSDGQTAQIENVLTLSRFRKRGLARAIVSKALEEARKGRHELIFLIADQRDWPKELYGKLGFDGVGLIWEFVLPRAE